MTAKTRARRTGLRFLLTLSVVLLVGVMFAGPALAAPGTIKVDGEDINQANSPHQGCNFEVEFEGFTESPGGTAGVEITAQPPTDNGVVGSGTTTLDGAGNGVINITIDPTGIEQHPIQGLHVTITAGVDGGDAAKKKTVWVEECAAPAPTTPPTTPPTTDVPPPVGGVDTGSGPGAAPSGLLAVVGLLLLAGSTFWMRRRSVHSS
jgi:MYXO-CTERM domain-containing protein